MIKVSTNNNGLAYSSKDINKKLPHQGKRR